ncbi:hypothetical protein IM697_04240 [Streptomyces ferrugineus]|uniref:Uncharacterized protein n=1 Tax=Streptomyces ferrugineus TaxID=1413221 RepID=A0A7M2SMR1_9ACTN|nr:hypothetical protein [Streptomyces ferrugineus]QOV37647.1 hypothetical protein IM697_04240 [Streptomyces ferrugineus]
MSRRDNGDIWSNTNQAARWLNVHHGLFRAFVWDCRLSGRLPDAFDYDTAQTPTVMVNQSWVYTNWETFHADWSAFCDESRRRKETAA